MRVVIGSIVALLVVALGWLGVHSPLLDVDRVVVSGARQTSPLEVRAAAGVEPGDALLFVDGGAVARRIEQLPWIGEVRVERNLPDELAVHVTERRAALWVRRSPEQIVLVDESGRVLANATAPPTDLPELVGLVVVPPPGGSISPPRPGRVLRALAPELRSQVVRMTLSASDVRLGVRAGPEIRLGTASGAEEKARAALAVLRTLDPPFPAYLDVSSPAAPVTG